MGSGNGYPTAMHDGASDRRLASVDAWTSDGLRPTNSAGSAPTSLRRTSVTTARVDTVESCPCRPASIGMSEGASFVNTALLEEEHDQPLRGPENAGVVERRARRSSPRAHHAPARAVKAGRRPPVGEALTARSFRFGQWNSKPVRASWMRLSALVAVDACAGRLQFPTKVRVRRGRARLPGHVFAGPRYRVRAWSDPAQPAVLNHILTTAPRREVMPMSRAGLLAASELAQPASAGARQRISPSRRPKYTRRSTLRAAATRPMLRPRRSAMRR